jgi:hypothetical protein
MTWIGIYLGALGLATAYGFWVDHLQDLDACNRTNRTIEKAVQVNGESIIEASAQLSDQPPSPEAIGVYREIQRENIQKVLEDC